MCFGKHSVAFLLRDGLDVSLRVGLAMFTASALKPFLFGKGAAAFISGQGWFRDTPAGCCACLQERASQHFLRNGSRDISLPRSIVSKTVSQQNALNPSSQTKTKPFPLNMSETPSLSKPPATFPTSDDPKLFSKRKPDKPCDETRIEWIGAYAHAFLRSTHPPSNVALPIGFACCLICIALPLHLQRVGGIA